MKKVLIIAGVASATILSAAQYYQQPTDQYYNPNPQYFQGTNYPSPEQEYYQQLPNNPYYAPDQQYYQGNRNPQFQGQQGQLNQGPVGNVNPYNQNQQQRNKPDQAISEEIGDIVGSGWFSKGFENVSFSVNNGIVNLRGTVDTENDRNKVVEKIRGIDGVRQVNSQITVAKEDQKKYSDADLKNSEQKFPKDAAASQPDRHINARIREKLNSGWFTKKYEGIVIRTANGFVTITGFVESPDEAKNINEELRNIEGIRGVNNQISVKNNANQNQNQNQNRNTYQNR